MCKAAFPDVFDILSSAHLAVAPFEKLPRKCKYCNMLPYKDEAEYQEDLRCYAANRADTSKEGAAAFLRERSNYAGEKKAATR